MNMFIKVTFADKQYELPLVCSDTFSIGSYEFDNIMLKHKSIKKGHLGFSIDKSGNVFLLSKGKTFVNGQNFKKGTIDIGDKITVSVGKTDVLEAELYEISEKMSVRINNEMTIGKKDVCSIAIMNPKVSRLHAGFYLSGKNVRIIDLNSSNGTYVNGRKITQADLKDGDEISIVDYNFKYSQGMLTFEKREEIECRTEDEPVMGKDYPIIHPSPRVKEEYRTGELQITNPPNIGNKPEINFVSLLLQPILMIAMSIAVASIYSTNSFMLSAPMSLISVALGITNHIAAKKKYKKTFELKISKYTEYIKNVAQELKTAVREQLKTMKDDAPETAECVSIVTNGEKEIWNRKSGDKDFLTFRIGHGKVEAGLKAKFQSNGFELQEDDLLSKIKRETEKYRIIDGAPITVDFKKNPVMGVYGERKEAKRLVKNLIIQATTFHTYNDLKIVALFSDSEKMEWNWMRWLPHCFNDDRSRRYVACEAVSIVDSVKTVGEILETRIVSDSEYENDKKEKLPFYLFVIADEELASNPLIQKQISQCGDGAGAVIISDSFDVLPSDTSVFAELSQGNGKLFTKSGENGTIEFKTDVISENDYERFARALAPLKLADVKGSTSLPNNITFLEGYGVRRPQELDLASRWANSKSYKSLSVPIGVKSNGELFMFDIHASKHGPFGIVAGMAGSGKSEMLQAWILSMALNFSPQEIAFVLVDFKGTGLILPFMKLPHLAGTISDIDKNISRNLVALENEMTRRKRIFDACGVRSIYEYIEKYRKGEVKEPLPITFIVIDEFAEFKIQFPDFAGQVVDSIMKTGRSLGIWAILSTQNPSGIVSDQTSANIKFKWCLKVAAPSYSSDMLGAGHTEAARITNPGRAYIKVGENELFEQIQSFWSGAPYNPTRSEKNSAAPKISFVNLDGSRDSFALPDKTIGSKSYISEIEAVVNYIDSYVTENGISHARKVWPPKLPEKVCLPSLLDNSFDGSRWPDNSNGLQAVIGLADDPISQSQYPLKLNLSEKGHAIVYGAPMTGKTTFLQTLVMSLCLSYSPDEVNVYAMDLGSMTLGMFKDYPHVGGVANSNEKEKIDKLALLMTELLNERKNKFSQVGVGSLPIYRKVANEQMPYMVLAIDNLPKLISQYPELQEFIVMLTSEGATYGIILVATATAANSVHFKITDNVKTKIALQLTDESDYSTVIGVKGLSLRPEDCCGRGLAAINKTPLEYQTAIPVQVDDEAEKVCEIKRIAKLMDEVWDGNLPQPIPLMPVVITFGSVRSEGITLGLSTSNIKPVSFLPTESHYYMISGTPSSGKTNMLKVVAKQFKNKFSAVVTFIDIMNAWYDSTDCCDNYICDVAQADEFFEDLAAELQKRKNSNETSDSLLIVVDNFERFIEEVSNETAKRLNALIRMGKNLNVYFIAAANNSDLTSRYNKGDSITTSLVNSKYKILLGESFNSHGIFETDLPFSKKSDELGQFEGYFIDGKKTVKFKTMKE